MGQIWHRWISQRSNEEFAQAKVDLDGLKKKLGVFFRGLGGHPAIEIVAGTAALHGASRSFWQRLAGSGHTVELAWINQERLYLPASIALFPQQQLNQDLYFWLTALTTQAQTIDVQQSWLIQNQHHTQFLCQQFPGLAQLYQRLLDNYLALRPAVDSHPQEQAIQQALRHPNSVQALPPAKQPFQPVMLWLHPNPPQLSTAPSKAMAETQDEKVASQQALAQDYRQRQAEYTDMPEKNKGLLMYRFETIFSWADFVKVDRSTEEEEEASIETADDIEVLSIARDHKTSAAKIRFDLDLPSSEQDDQILQQGIFVPEWHCKQQQLQANHCQIILMQADTVIPCELPAELRPLARRLKQQFLMLAPSPIWQKAQTNGYDIDLDAYSHYQADKLAGQYREEANIYLDFIAAQRDLSCLLLADLSLSTDAWIANDKRIIDVIRQSLWLFAESLTMTQDQLAIYGFCSRYRQHVRFYQIKTFQQRYNAMIRGQINAIRPNYYTRMGAGIRQASRILAQQATKQRLLLVLTDGKPNDLDQYEGRYGIEDTRMALLEARQQGLQTFAVTIDDKAADYMPYLFGQGNFVVLRHPHELPSKLPLLYAKLTQS